jgi:hypothetical protein
MTNLAIWRQHVDAVAVRQTLAALEIVVRPDPSFWSVRSAPGHGLPRFRFSRPFRTGHCHHRSWGVSSRPEAASRRGRLTVPVKRRADARDGKGEPATPPGIAQARGPLEWYEDATENTIDAEGCSAGDPCAQQPAPTACGRTKLAADSHAIVAPAARAHLMERLQQKPTLYRYV